jgi:plasmid stability protein
MLMQEKTIVTFQTTQAQRDMLAKVADEHDRSISAEIRRALRAHLWRERTYQEEEEES